MDPAVNYTYNRYWDPSSFLYEPNAHLYIISRWRLFRDEINLCPVFSLGIFAKHNKDTTDIATSRGPIVNN